jgi:DNA (cytosine-5)-methyltransferase 1
MAQGRMIPLFQEILGELRACGYKVIARVLDASYLGAPQARKRMIIIGVRNDLPFLPVHPRPSLPRRTVRDAFEGLPRDDPQAPRPGGKLGRLTARIPQGRRGADVLKNTGLKASYYNTIRLHWDQPSRTICKLWAPGRAGELYPDQERYVGVRELSRLQGFPDEFDWGRPAPGRPYHRWYADVHARIGNSVPPLMSYAIASTLRTAVLEPARSKEAA